MPSNYPANLDSWPTIGPLLSSTPHSDVHEDLQDAIEAVQTELGTDPAGASSTVRARLDLINTHVAELRAVAANRTAVLALPGVFAGRTVWETERQRQWTWNGSAWMITGGSIPRAARASTTFGIDRATSWQGVPMTSLTSVFDTDGFLSGSNFVVPAGFGGAYRVEAAGSLLSGFPDFEGNFGVGYRIFGNSGLAEVPKVEQWGIQPTGSASNEFGGRASAARTLRLRPGAIIQLTVFQSYLDPPSTPAFMTFQDLGCSISMVSHEPGLAAA